jgi:general secretion pathway protein C
MSARWSSFLVWALVAASAAFWGLRLFVTPPAAPPQTRLAQAAPAVRGDLTRLLGADPPPPVAAATTEPPPDARFQLLGVVSPRGAGAVREGVALIAVDGRPPKAFRIGAVVDGPNVLQSVNARGATLGPRGGAALVALNIPPPAPAATGMLPPAGAPLGQPQPQAVPQSFGPNGVPPRVPPQVPMPLRPQPDAPQDNTR